MSALLRFNKPFQMLSQFRAEQSTRPRPTLATYFHNPNLRLVGRLDHDSEGLLLLTDNGQWLHYLAHPRFACQKCYWVQVEGAASPTLLMQLLGGVQLNDGLAQAAVAEILDPAPTLWPREPPIRFRQSIPTTWLRLCLHEGRNRQIRRMTAACGFPTLRLIRYQVGPWQLDALFPGEVSEVFDASNYFATNFLTRAPLSQSPLAQESLAKPRRRVYSSRLSRRK